MNVLWYIFIDSIYSFIDQLLRNTINCSVLNHRLMRNLKLSLELGLKLSVSSGVPLFCQLQFVLSFSSINMDPYINPSICFGKLGLE